MDSKSTLPEGFVYVKDLIPEVIEYLRYGTTENFVGKVVNGYVRTDRCVMTKISAEALRIICDKLGKDGYQLVIYDTYRPQRAVDHFIEWAKDMKDVKTQESYYPLLSKEEIFEKGYVAKQSGHSRGSTLDVGLLKIGDKLKDITVIKRKFKNGREYNYLDDGTVDMGTSWDFLDESSHYENDLVSDEITQRRMYLRGLFEEEGFKITHREWWHFRYLEEPFPETYFDFVVQ